MNFWECKDAEAGDRVIYIGESSRSIWERRKEHEEAKTGKNKQDKSYMYRHEMEIHGG